MPLLEELIIVWVEFKLRILLETNFNTDCEKNIVPWLDYH